MKPLLILRDPVDRLKSHASQRYRKSGKLSPEDEIARLYRMTSLPPVKAKSDYVTPLSAIPDVFANDHLVLLFENLFTESSLRNVTEFLDIDYVPAQFSEKKNVTATEHLIPRSDRARLAQHFAPQIRAAMHYFGDDTIRQHWPSAEFID